MNRNVLVLIVLVLALAALLFINKKMPPVPLVSASACDHPLQYRIGAVDPRFAITNDDFLEAIKKGGSVWEGAANRKLFEYDPQAPFTINLIYDDRQSNTEDREKMAWKQEANKALYDNLKAQYESQKASYEAGFAAYNNEVETRNRQEGRITREDYDRLQRERVDLETSKDQLNGLVGQLNALAWTDRTQVAEYNKDAEKKFAAGECVRNNAGTDVKINIYQFKNNQDLALKLAHEMGHALSLNHVSNPKSVMYYLIKDQDADNLSLSQEDKAALAALCHS